jgi:hypothetical protein
VERILLGSFDGYRRTWVRPDVLAAKTYVLRTATAEGEPPLVETVQQAIESLAHWEAAH